MKYLSLGYQNLIRYFINYLEYITYDNDPIGDDWINITYENFNDFCIKDYYNYRRLRDAVLINPRTNSTTPSCKPQSSADNLKIPIKSDPTTARYDMVTPFFNGNKNIISVTTEKCFVSHAQVVVTKRDKGRKVKLDISRVSTNYDSNTIGPHSNALLPDEESNKTSNTDIDTASKPYLHTTQCAKYIFNDPLDLNLKPPSSSFAR